LIFPAAIPHVAARRHFKKYPIADKSDCRRSPTCYLDDMKTKTARDVAALARRRRGEIGWSQARLAEAVGVGREWIIDFEKGKSTVEWGLVLRTLKELNLQLDLSPALPARPSRAGTDLSAILDRTRRRP
jgi:HTH-type transcriptional regulator/antitoxin HipB